MRGAFLLAALPPLLAACAAQSRPAAAERASGAVVPAAPAAPAVPSQGPAPTEAELFGRWRIVAIDGVPPLAPAGERGGERMPSIVFGAGGYGGTSGCNSFGGMGVLVGDRYYASAAGQTEMACRGLMEQEAKIVAILTASPRVARVDGGISLASPRGAMALSRDMVGTPASAAPAGPAVPLAGSVWAIGGVDGRRLPAEGRRTLRFEAERWLFVGPCGGRGGDWRQQGDRIEAVADPSTPPPCAAEDSAADIALAALLAARPRLVAGPNGEILIGGGGHWATGGRPRAPLEDDAPLLFGTWRIVAIDGAPPAGAAPSQLAFGLSGYSGGAGCNSMQGYYLAHGRRLFAPPPVRTEMACGPPLDAQEDRVARLLGGAPRIALAEGGELALIGETGSLRLRRQGGAPAWSPVGRLWAGAPLRAELTMFDGEPLQSHYSEPATRLRLSARRFDVETGCGRIGGIWRRPSYPPGDEREVRAGPGEIELVADSEPDPAGACAASLVRRLAALRRMLNGRARILIGASGELTIAGEEHMLVGRVLR